MFDLRGRHTCIELTRPTFVFGEGRTGPGQLVRWAGPQKARTGICEQGRAGQDRADFFARAHQTECNKNITAVMSIMGTTCLTRTPKIQFSSPRKCANIYYANNICNLNSVK